jgi:predicted O-methyltransferase YrrM
MEGNLVTRSAHGLLHLVRRPRHGARWVRDRVSKASPLELGLPWFSWPAIEYLETTRCRPGARVFEYGGGGSTIYLLNRGCQVRTAENSVGWAEQVLTRARAAGHESRLDLRIVDMPEHPTAAERPLTERYVAQIEAPEPWDLVIVDGVDGTPSTRLECLERARSSLSPGAALVLDDAWRPTYARAPEILRGFTRHAFVGLGPARWGVTQTDVYTRE